MPLVAVHDLASGQNNHLCLRYHIVRPCQCDSTSLTSPTPDQPNSHERNEDRTSSHNNLQLGMSEVAAGTIFHQRPVSLGLHEFHERSWKNQQSVTCTSAPDKCAVANPEFCSDFQVYLSLGDQLGVLELVVWSKDMLTI